MFRVLDDDNTENNDDNDENDLRATAMFNDLPKWEDDN